MSLLNDNCFYLPRFIALKPISNGAKFLYILLYDNYGDINKFNAFLPNDYKTIMRCSCRTLYRYFGELLMYNCIFEENGNYVFVKELKND